MGIVSKVKRGDNSGETLIHDFLVINHKSHSPKHVTTWKVPMIDIPDVKQKNNVLVIWISSGHSQEILQSVAGYL